MKKILALSLMMTIVLSLVACGTEQAGTLQEGEDTTLLANDLNDEEREFFDYLVNSNWRSEVYADDIEGEWSTPERGITIDFHEDFAVDMDNNGELQSGDFTIEYSDVDDTYVIIVDFGDDVYESYLWDFDYYLDLLNFDANIGIGFISDEISDTIFYDDGADVNEETQSEIPSPTSTTTDISIDVSNDIFTLTLAGRAAEELWYGVEKAKVGEAYDALLKTNFNAFLAGLHLDLTYMNEEIIPSTDVDEYTLTREAITFSIPVADLPTMSTMNSDGTSGPDKTFDFNEIVDVTFWVIHDASDEDVEYHEVIAIEDIAVTGDIPTSVTVEGVEDTSEDTLNDNTDTITTEPKSETTDIAVNVKNDVLTMTISGRAAESFWIEVQKSKIGEALIPTLSVDIKSERSVDADFTVTYDDYSDQTFAQPPANSVTYDENSVVFTALIADLPPKIVFDAAGNRSEEPFEPLDIEAFDLFPPDGQYVDDWEWFEAEDVSITIE